MLAVIIGCVIAVVASQIRYAPMELGFVALFLALLFAPQNAATAAAAFRRFANNLPARAKRHPNRPSGEAHSASLFEKLHDEKFFTQWVNSLEPVARPCQDLFGLTSIAKRYIDRVSRAEDRDIPSLGLVAPYGAGKSSTVNLMAWYARRLSPMIKIVRVSPWGLTDGEASVRLILDAVVQGLSEHADCFSIRGIPQQVVEYLRASTSGKAISIAFSPQPSPTDALQRLSRLLVATDIRLIICIEDADRNLDAVQFAPKVEALLSQLRSCSNLGVVLSISSAAIGIRFDLAKLCTYEERFPPISPRDVSAWYVHVMRRLRPPAETTHALPGHNKGGALHETLADDASLSEYSSFNQRVYHGQTLEGAVRAAAGTPRGLKDTARHALLAWEELEGEIDPQQLFQATVIRTNLKNTWNWIVRNEYVLFHGARNASPIAPEVDLDAIRKELDDANASDGIERWMFLKLVNDLFPYAPSELFNAGFTPPRQGLSADKQRYWFRFLRGEIGPEDFPDQPVLSAIRSFDRFNPDREFLQRCLNDQEYYARVNHFHACFELATPLDAAYALLKHHRAAPYVAETDKARTLNAVKLGIRYANQDSIIEFFNRQVPQAIQFSLGHAANVIGAFDGDPIITDGLLPNLLTDSIRKTFAEAGKGLPYIFAAADESVLKRLLLLIPDYRSNKALLSAVGGALREWLVADNSALPHVVSLVAKLNGLPTKSYPRKDGMPVQWEDYAVDNDVLESAFGPRAAFAALLADRPTEIIVRPDLREFAERLVETLATETPCE